MRDVQTVRLYRENRSVPQEGPIGAVLDIVGIVFLAFLCYVIVWLTLL